MEMLKEDFILREVNFRTTAENFSKYFLINLIRNMIACMLRFMRPLIIVRGTHASSGKICKY